MSDNGKVQLGGVGQFGLFGKANQAGTVGVGLDYKGSGFTLGGHAAQNIPTGIQGVGGSVKLGGDTGAFAKHSVTHFPELKTTKHESQVGYQGDSGGVSAGASQSSSTHGPSASAFTINVFKSF